MLKIETLPDIGRMRRPDSRVEPLLGSANAFAKSALAWFAMVAMVAIAYELGQSLGKGYFALLAMAGIA
jgi:hypothetical protein